MNESASGDLGARERRRRDTYTALTHVARALTAERGLNGFTVEELCDGVGVSRRTFFNYFATKEDAVLGARMADPLEPFAEDFVASGPAAGASDAPASGRRPDPAPVPLPEALLALFLRAYGAMDIPRADVHAYLRAMHAEPALMKRMIETGMRRQRTLAALIARREGLDAEDPYASLVSSLSSHLAMTSFQEFVGHPAECADVVSAEPEESPDEALARFTAILTAKFAHAARLFGP
ncbi:MAG: helix-turn-helix domain-containing protein [Arthrobacter sp.]|uniref:TetR/AcrR family transcriptional regulator n=1 Tax=Arthrobacter sp. TaxID=1667 RepID=UPI003490262A